jgi:ankyrin repeat protein
MVACRFDHFDIADVLIIYNCNINCCNAKGSKAIHIAVKERKSLAICRLIEIGLRINCVDFHNKTPLHYAARLGDTEIGKLLIDLGAELSPLDYKGRSPAGLAEEKEHFNFSDTLERLGGRKVKGYETEKNEPEAQNMKNFYAINVQLVKDLSAADKVYKKVYKISDG